MLITFGLRQEEERGWRPANRLGMPVWGAAIDTRRCGVAAPGARVHRARARAADSQGLGGATRSGSSPAGKR